MSRRETVRGEAERRGVSHGKIFNERKAQDLIDKMGGDVDIVYAWRWSNDNTCAKIGVSTVGKFLAGRIAPGKTYHPTDDPVLIGFIKCRSRKIADNIEKYLLRILEQTHPDREWVIIDEKFNDRIDELFISDPNVLSEIFGGDIKIETSIPKLKGESS